MKLIENEWRYYDLELQIPYPWYTKPALEFIEKIDLKRKEIFEFGAGDSTRWYREKGAIVKGVDNGFRWADSDGITCEMYYPAYVDHIDRFGLFDIIVIDGAQRRH
jgi:hypothetical protein